MKRSIFTALCLVLASGAIPLVLAQTGERRRMLTVPEIMKIINESPVEYKIICPIQGLEDVNTANTADRLFPLSVRPITSPVRVEKEDGSTEIIEMPLSPEGQKILDEAEAHFVAGRFPEAILDYQRLIDLCPDCYLAYAHLGDSYFRMRKFEKAIGYFDTAISLNPCDHRTFVYKGDALMNLGRLDAARAAYIHSLSLCPRYWLALANLRHCADKLGVEVRTDLFRPGVIVRPEDKAIAVYVDDREPLALWLAYGLTKAVWRGEPSHRTPILGDPNYRWTVAEELESLRNLLVTYEMLKHDGKMAPDPRLDRLEVIAADGHLVDFIFYEIASRMCPHITLTLPEEARQSLREFIAKYVVVSVSQEPVKKANEVVAAEVALPGVPQRQGDQPMSAQ
jgi:tetratricopeptide (TPR) repeat protein